jgi:hypothetical protein
MPIAILRQRITSSDIASIGYDAASEQLDIEFHCTGVYRYYSVPKQIHTDLIATDCPGKYFLQNIKCKYAWDPHRTLFPTKGTARP